MLESYQKKKKSPMKLFKSLKAGMLTSGFENLSIMNLLLLFLRPLMQSVSGVNIIIKHKSFLMVTIVCLWIFNLFKYDLLLKLRFALLPIQKYGNDYRSAFTSIKGLKVIKTLSSLLFYHFSSAQATCFYTAVSYLKIFLIRFIIIFLLKNNHNIHNVCFHIFLSKVLFKTSFDWKKNNILERKKWKKKYARWFKKATRSCSYSLLFKKNGDTL